MSDYVDGQLDEATRRSVEHYLEQNPRDRERVRAYEIQNRALAEAYRPVLEEPVPDHLLRTVEEAGGGAWRRRRAGRLRRFWPAAAAAGLALVVGSVAGWAIRAYHIEAEAQRLGLQMFVQEAVSSYALYAQDESAWVRSGLEEDRGEFGEWFRQEQELEILAPDLDDAGFKFVGGRALPAWRGSAGQAIYSDGDGNLVALYFQYMDRERTGEPLRVAPRPRQATGTLQRDDVSVYYWSTDKDSVIYALVGSLDEDGLISLGEKIIGELD